MGKFKLPKIVKIVVKMYENVEMLHVGIEIWMKMRENNVIIDKTMEKMVNVPICVQYMM
jgi:hypothetical protein